MDADFAPRLGHNEPPLEELLIEESAALAARRDELIASASRAPSAIPDEPTAQKVADLVRLISACIKGAEAARVARKEQFLASGRLVDAAYRKITDPLDRAKRQIEAALTQYQRRKAEDERRAREAEARRQAEEAERQRQTAERQRQEAERLRLEAERQAAVATTDAEFDAAIDIEAAGRQISTDAVSAAELARQAEADAVRAQREAEAKAAELARTRGDLGSVASLRTFYDFCDLDKDRIDLETLRPFLATDAIERAIRGFIRSGGRELHGVKIFVNTATSVR